MRKIEISEQLNSDSQLPDLLRHIAEQIENGFTCGYNPTWKITEPVGSDKKTEKINYIKRVIREWGGVTTRELELDSSPEIVKSHGDIIQLVERFNNDGVDVIIYHHGHELDVNNINYEDLDDDMIDEICTIIENYEVNNLKTEKRCQS